MKIPPQIRSAGIRDRSTLGSELIRCWDATDAAAYKGARLREGLLDKSNTASTVWADPVYRSKANEEFLERCGFVTSSAASIAKRRRIDRCRKRRGAPTRSSPRSVPASSMYTQYRRTEGQDGPLYPHRRHRPRHGEDRHGQHGLQYEEARLPRPLRRRETPSLPGETASPALASALPTLRRSFDRTVQISPRSTVARVRGAESPRVQPTRNKPSRSYKRVKGHIWHQHGVIDALAVSLRIAAALLSLDNRCARLFLHDYNHTHVRQFARDWQTASN